MLSLSSRSSSPGHAMRVTSREAVRREVKAPGRCTVALRRYVTEPKSHWRVGGELAGIANEIGYV